MKRNKFLWCFISAVLAVVMALTGCAPDKPNEEGGGTTPPSKVTYGDKCIDLEILQYPEKTEYKVGEKFSPKGLVFNAIYENGFEGDYSLVGGDLDGYIPSGALTEDVTEIILQFEGYQKAIPVTVIPKALNSVTITREPDIKAYSVGDALDLNGLIVAADYDEGLVENETNYVITDADGNVYEQGTVLDTAVNGLVLTVSVKSGTVTKSDSFTIGVYSGLTVQVEDVYNGEDEQPVDKSYTVITGNNLKTEFTDNNSGTHILNNCSYTGTGYLGNVNNGLSVEFFIYSEIDMPDADLVLLASSTCDNAAEQKMDDMQVNKLFKVYIDKNGDGEYSDDEEVDIADYVVIEGKDYPAAGSGGNKWTNWADVPLGKIDINEGYTRVKLVCIGTVKDGSNYARTPNIDRLDIRMDGGEATAGDMVTGVTVTTQPDKTEYTVGESFDPSGIVFSASYMNGYAGDTTLGAENVKVISPSVLTLGTDKVTLKYKTFTFTVDVTVTAGPVESVEITRNPTITSYAKGGTLNLEGLIVKATYENGFADENATNYTVKDASGNVYTTGTVLDGEYADSQLTLIVEITSDGTVKTAEFTIKIFSGITVEAENFYVEGTTGSTESYTVLQNKGDAKVNTNANAAVCIENIPIGLKIEFYIYSDVDVTGAQLVLRACSVDRKVDGTGTYSTNFNEVFKLYQEDEQITVGDDVEIVGRDKIGSELLWFVWTENVIATVDLKAGYNKITLECIAKHKDTNGGDMRVPNIDRIDIRF